MLYDFSSLAVTVGLFAVITATNELGFRIGRYVQDRTDNEVKSLTGAVQASVLGLLALLLGFSFNLSMQRFDARNHALIDEVNQIGTTALRAKLLPTIYQGEASELLHEYVKSRVEVGGIDLTKVEERRDHDRRSAELQERLWSVAVTAIREETSAATSGAFVAALNGLIDSQGKRNALLQMRVPEAVLLLLFTVFVSAGGILGYSSGLSGHRMLVPTGLVALLISMIVFLIIDLDRPKRGFIQVDQTPMVEMLRSL